MPLAVGDPWPGPSLQSPSGRHRVRFEVVAHRTYGAEDRLRAVENTDHVEYRVSFLNRDTDSPVAIARFTDVYGWDETARPTPLERLADRLVWSPREEFVILPVEGWASAPGTSSRLVVALDARLGWSRSAMILEHLAWISPLRVIGDRHGDCDHAVDLFDGEIGEQRALIPSASPIGYRIAAVSGETVILRQVLDNCSGEAERAAFVERCLSRDFGGTDPIEVPCP